MDMHSFILNMKHVVSQSSRFRKRQALKKENKTSIAWGGQVDDLEGF